MAAVVRAMEETVTEEMTGGVVSAMAVAVPVTERDAVPALELTVTVPAKLPAAVGLKRATAVWLAPAPRLNEPPEMTLKGAALDAVPVRVPPPVLVTVKERSTEPPRRTAPKSTAVRGLTDKLGELPVPLTGLPVGPRRAPLWAPRARAPVA